MPSDWQLTLEPIAGLPIWAVAALLAATVAALVIVVPVVIRWLWMMVSRPWR